MDKNLADELARARVRVVGKNLTDDRDGWLVEVVKLLGLLEDNWLEILTALRGVDYAGVIELERWGIEWREGDVHACKQMPDGYWTPWHIADAAIRAQSALPAPAEDGLRDLLAEAREQLNDVSAITGNLEWRRDLGQLVDRLDAALTGTKGDG